MVADMQLSIYFFCTLLQSKPFSCQYMQGSQDVKAFSQNSSIFSRRPGLSGCPANKSAAAGICLPK